MPCAVTLSFDSPTDSAIRGLWQALSEAGLPSTMLTLGFGPHLTFSVCQNLDLDKLQAPLQALAVATPPLTVQFSSIGVFPGKEGVVFLGVTVNHALLDFHTAFWDTAAAYSEGASPYYRPEIWVPHVTLNYALAPGQIGPVVEFLTASSLPVQGILVMMEITHIREDGNEQMFVTRLRDVSP